MSKKKKHKKSKKPETQEQQQEQLMEEGLEAIYGKEQIDFSKLDQKQKQLSTLLLRIVIGLGLLAVIAWSGFFIFLNYVNPIREETFIVDIIMDEMQVSGQETVIEIPFENPTNVPIAALSIDVNLPSTFVVNETNQPPTDAEQLIWDLGGMTGLSDDHIVITGTWLEEVPSETPIQVYATYKPGNFNADFEEIAVTYATTVESVLDVHIEGPEERSPGQSGTYTITVENTGSYTYPETDIALLIPDGFYLESSTPEIPSGSPPIWTLESLPGETLETFAFTGAFTADVEGFQYFDVEARVRTDNRTLTQAEAQSYTDVLKSDVNLSLAANGATEQTTVDQDGTLRVSVALEQTGDEAIEDFSLLLSFESDEGFPIEWNDAQLDGGVLTQEGIVWTQDTIGALEPNQSETLNLSFPIEQVADGISDAFTITALLTTQQTTVRSSTIDIGVNSEATFDASARFYNEDGQPIGSGPLPPQVGETTTMRIYWTIQNDLHTLGDTRVTATLPPDVRWEEGVRADLGTLSYDEASNTVEWTVPEISSALSTVQGSFLLSITPEMTDVGRFAKLISGSTLSTTDTITSAQLQRSDDALTSELPDDPFAEGQGLVTE